IYGLIERDYNDDILRTTVPGSVISTRFDYNAEYLGIGSNGAITDELAYGAEFVYEAGNTLSNSFNRSMGTLVPVPQTHDTIEAVGADLRFDFLPGDVHHTRYSAEVLVTTGDADRQVATDTFGGNKPHTRDNSFNAFGLLDTGLAFSPQPSNLLMLRFGISTFPFSQYRPLSRLQVG